MSFMRVTVSSQRFKAAIARAPELAAKEMTQAVHDVSQAFRAHVVESRLSGPPGLNAGTGTLRRSLDYHLVQSATGPASLIGFYGEGARSANIHEKGGTIVANGKASKCGKGKMLAIPLGPAKTANGHLRRGPCEYGNLTLIRSKKGNLLLVQTSGKGDDQERTFVPMFVLKPQVTIPARMGFRSAWKAFAPRALARVKKAQAAIMAGVRGTR